MIRFTIIIIGIFMIIKKLYEIIKFKIEAYRDTSNKHFSNVQVNKNPKEIETGLVGLLKCLLIKVCYLNMKIKVIQVCG